MSTTRKPIIIVYSDDSSVRTAIVAALGKRVAADLPEHQIEEFATAAALRAIDAKDFDAILQAGDTLYAVCDSCHQQFWYPGQQ